jgi:hypothetical protein
MLPRIFLSIAALSVCLSLHPVRAAAQPDQHIAAKTNPRSFDASAFGERITLGPDWLFSAGDNPTWVSPTFDDSGWQTISTKHQLADFGIHDIHSAWYRIHIHLRSSEPNANNLTVAIEGVQGSYEIYANGVRIGGHGKMHGLSFILQSRLLAFPIPSQALNPQGDTVIAIRVALNPTGINGGGTSTPLGPGSGVYLLSAGAVARDASYIVAHSAGHFFIISGLNLIVGLVALGLYLALRSQKEYLAAAAYLFISAALFLVDALNILTDKTPSIDWIEFLLFGAANVALIEFVRLVLSLPRTRLLLGLEIAAGLCGLWSPLSNYPFGTFYLGFIGFFGPILLVNILLIVLLVRAWRAGNTEARVLLPAVVFEGLYRHWSFLHYLVYYLHLTREIVPMPMLHAGTYTLALGDVSDFIFLIAILLFLVLRTVGIARRHAQATAELEAARIVQQIIIPDESPVVPGFVIRSVYKPFGEVGGDFFQILPVAHNAVLVVIGDVSGKGMAAAMTVSLLVGTVRTLAHYTQSPGEILAAMNHRMLARSNGGFTTCLVLRADAAGTLTIANAGHIAPYLAGKELPLQNGLPLGLAAGVTYTESTFQLAAGQQLTLLTDGVIEARGKSGALLGFEQTAALSRHSAEIVAQAAEAFGQDDDITVLTLQRSAIA